MPIFVRNLFLLETGDAFVHFFNFINDKIQQNIGSYAIMLKNILEQLHNTRDLHREDIVTASIVDIISTDSEHVEKIFNPSQSPMVSKLKAILRRLAELAGIDNPWL